MASTGLCGPQQARSWMKACYDVSTDSEACEHLGSEIRFHPDSSCLKGEKNYSRFKWVVCVCDRPFLFCLCRGLDTEDTGKGLTLCSNTTHVACMWNLSIVAELI